LSAGAVLVRTNAGRVDRHVFCVRILSENLENASKYATFTPSNVASMHGDTVTEALRQIAPRNARAIAEDDSIDEQSVVRRRAADVPLAASYGRKLVTAGIGKAAYRGVA